MKKLYAFFAAALMSASMFAAAPTAAEIAAAYDITNNVVFVIEFIEDAEVCNDIRFVGTPNNWGKGETETESWDNCEKFAPVEGHEGWYAAELAYSEGFGGKPLQEPTDRSWTWDYQCGDMDAWVHVDGLELALTAGYAGECNIAASAPGAYIYQLKYWKNHKTPCAPVVKHNYTIKLYAPDACAEMKPAISGDDMGWGAPIAMNEELDDDFETVYTYSFEGQEGHGFKIREVNDDSNWSNQMQHYDAENDVWKDNDNYELGAEETIVLEWSNNQEYRFKQCDGQAPCDTETKFNVKVSVKVPAGAPEAGVEIIGGFDGGDWAGIQMEWNASTNYYEANIETLECAEFKFREAGTWDNEIVDVETGEGLKNIKVRDAWNEAKDAIELDFSEGYVWKANFEGIEEIVLTEKARKVVVEGQLYIVRDNKLFNVTGVQVR